MDGVSDTRLHLWRVTSGWGGPFQYEEVLVAAPDLETARVHAEGAFGGVTQPVCRARMRLHDLGPVAEGVVAGPRRSGEDYPEAALTTDVRCADPAAG